MAIPPQVRTKFYALRALAVLLGLFAGAIFILRPPGFGLHLLAFLAIFIGLWIVRRSNASVWRARGDVLSEWSSNKAGRVGPLAWILVAASLLVCGATYFLMYLDALHGGKEVWPVYAFAGAGLTLVLTLGNLIARISR